MCLVTWPLNESEAGVDLVLIETSRLFVCKFLLISMRTASLTWEKQGGFYQNKVTSSLTFIQATKQETVKWSIVTVNSVFQFLELDGCKLKFAIYWSCYIVVMSCSALLKEIIMMSKNWWGSGKQLTLFINGCQFIILLSLCKLASQASLSCAKLKRILALKWATIYE